MDPIKSFLWEVDAIAWIEKQKSENFLLWTFLRIEFNPSSGNYDVFDNEGVS